MFQVIYSSCYARWKSINMRIYNGWIQSIHCYKRRDCSPCLWDNWSNHFEEEVVMESMPCWRISCVALRWRLKGRWLHWTIQWVTIWLDQEKFCQLCHFQSRYPILSSSFAIHSMIGKLAQEIFCHVYRGNEDLGRNKHIALPQRLALYTCEHEQIRYVRVPSRV